MNMKPETRSMLSEIRLSRCPRFWVPGVHFYEAVCAKGEDLQLVGDLRGRMLVLSDFEQGPQCLRWAGPSMKVQDFWSPGTPSTSMWSDLWNGHTEKTASLLVEHSAAEGSEVTFAECCESKHVTKHQSAVKEGHARAQAAFGGSNIGCCRPTSPLRDSDS